MSRSTLLPSPLGGRHAGREAIAGSGGSSEGDAGGAPAPGEGTAHAAALAEHLATLIELHRDDDADCQPADPIDTVEQRGKALLLHTASGRKFALAIVEVAG